MNTPSHRQSRVRRTGGKTSKQSGAYALEFALIFPLAFVLMYAVIALSLIFFLKQNLQFAAEQGARAALVYQPIAANRLSAAVTTAANYLARTVSGTSPPTATLCKVGEPCAPGSPPALCGNSVTDACLVRVVTQYDFRQAETPMFVSFPLPVLGFILPSPFILQGSATALISGSSI